MSVDKKYKAWDEYVSDKPILKDMIGELAQGLLVLQKNMDAMHTRQEKMWGDITNIMAYVSKLERISKQNDRSVK